MKLIHALTAHTLAGLIGLAWAAAAPAACSGPKITVADEARSSSMVVVGTAIEAHKAPSFTEDYAYTIYVVRVDEVLSGQSPKSFWLYSRMTAAQYPMTIGVPHLLFVRHKPMEDVVDPCGNSGPRSGANEAYRAAKAQARASGS